MLLSVFSTFLKSTDVGYVPTTLGPIALSVIMVLIFLLGNLILGKSKSKSKAMTTKELCVSAILIAIAYVLSNIKLFELPQGGSVTLCSMLFVCIVGYLFGARVGLTAAFAYGLLQLITGPYIIHPVQVLLDYPFAFACLGLSGFFSNKKFGYSIGFLVGSISRYIVHVISGIIFFGQYAGKEGPIIYSCTYNLAVLAEAGLSIVLLAILYPAVKRVKILLINDNTNTVNNKDKEVA